MMSSLVYADCVDDVCLANVEGCESSCSVGELDQVCTEIVCRSGTYMGCSDECIEFVQKTTSTGSETAINLNEHNQLNIAINNLKTEVNQINSENKKLSLEIDAISKQLEEKPSPLKQNLGLYSIIAVMASGLFILGISNKSQLKKISQPKISEEKKHTIQTYMQTYSNHYPKEQIMDGLKQQGFTEEEIKLAQT